MRGFSVLLMVIALGIAGCGGDDDESSGSSGGGGGDTPGLSGDAKKQAVENCQKTVDSAPQLSDKVKDDIVKICEEAADGDEEDVRKASKDVCEAIIKDTVPAGPARDQALPSCETAAP